MTDRYSAIVVVLDKDLQEDDAERLMQSIRLLDGVVGVGGHVGDIDRQVAATRSKAEISENLDQLLND